MPDPQQPDASTPSGAYREMAPDWTMIADIRAGAAAIRAKGTAYLPKFTAEDMDDYTRRAKAAPWRPEWSDCFAHLVAKPFGKDVCVEGAESPELKDFIEDVDARGSNITQFAKSVFEGGLAAGVHAIFVEHTPTAGAVTRADEQRMGARPYLIHVPALNLLAVYFDLVNGQLLPVYARIRECIVEQDGFGEKETDQIRELKPGSWTTYRQNDKKEWVAHKDGTTSLSYVPLVLFFAGERKGDFCVRPPLLDLAHLQIELYQALSRQEEILNFAGFPMLSANGFSQPADPIVVGPGRVLFAPPGESATSWQFIQPDADNIREVRSHIESIIEDMRRLGMQPLVQRAGGITATATSVDSAKAHSVLQSWVMSLKDALEHVFVMVGDYIKAADKVEVMISTDFSAEAFSQPALNALKEARAAKDISGETYRAGLKRFNVLPADFDEQEEFEALAEEERGLEPEMLIDPATGEPVEKTDPADDTELPQTGSEAA